MTNTARFKIDLYDSTYGPFGLYVLVPARGWRPRRWKYLNDFSTREQAVEFYEKIKDLPEYLT